MIKRSVFILPGNPRIMGKERAVAPCGCQVFVGIRMDNNEAATSAASCSSKHEDLMEKFNEAMVESLENPTARPLIDVVDDILEKVYREGVKDVA